MSFSNFNYAAEWFGLVDRYDQAIREKKEELWSGRFLTSTCGKHLATTG